MGVFNLSHEVKTTVDMGQLIPVGCLEVLPSDVLRHQISVLVRLSPMAAPVMHRIDARVHCWFAPSRLLWTGFEDLITGGEDGNDASTFPTITTTGTANDLLDYFGIPSVAGKSINALPIYGYNSIFNHFYRDQDLVTEVTETSTAVQKVAWPKDRYTTARSSPQRGTAVALPLGDKAPVTGIGMNASTFGGSTSTVYETGASSTQTYAPYMGSSSIVVEEDSSNTGYPGIFADLSNASGTSITAFRRALALQRFMEERQSYGARYAELLAKAYGVRNQDGRLDRPEYLGGGSTQIAVSEVMQTAPETGTVDGTDFGVGDLYGHGIGAARISPYRRRFPEHGYVICLLSIRPKAMYMDGVDPLWLAQDREDIWNRELQHIGQEEVKQGEVYLNVADPHATFGYNDRYDRYRESQNRVSAQMRTSLGNYWHLARSFGSSPALNQTFTDCDPTKRIFNDTTTHAAQVTVQHRIRAQRPVAQVARNILE